MKKLLSYLWPQTTKIPSDYNGELEVTLYNGKKMLDSKNANYSFGSLQRILEKGLSEINFEKVKTVLILGLGGGSVINSLREKFNYNQSIHAVELDEKIIQIAEKEFGIKASENLIIENTDAFDFVLNTDENFDVIIVDIFIDNQVPNDFYSESFCENVIKIMTLKGRLVFNLGFMESSNKQQNFVIDYFENKQQVHLKLLKKVNGTNTLLILEKD